MKPPSDARHYVFASESAKHGDIWAWTLPDGRMAYRESRSLRGWITEEDAVVTLDGRGFPTSIVIRGFNDQGDATENYLIDAAGKAVWKTTVDEGSGDASGKIYNSYGGPILSNEALYNALLAAGDKGVDLLPSGHAEILRKGIKATVNGPSGPKTVELVYATGLGFSPDPIWIDDENKLFGSAGVISILPAGYEANGPKLRKI